MCILKRGVLVHDKKLVSNENLLLHFDKGPKLVMTWNLGNGKEFQSISNKRTVVGSPTIHMW